MAVGIRRSRCRGCDAVGQETQTQPGWDYTIASISAIAWKGVSEAVATKERQHSDVKI
jgi:hypothetical protein